MNNAIEFIERFVKSHGTEYANTAREYRAGNGYGSSADASGAHREALSCAYAALPNYSAWVNETFGDMRIPEAFPSPNALRQAIENTCKVLRNDREILLRAQAKKHENTPLPISEALRENNELLHCLEHALTLDTATPSHFKRLDPRGENEVTGANDAHAPAQRASGTLATLPEPRVVDIVLKGGGAKGLAYAGALEILEQVFKVRSYAGTSAGAVGAALLAVGYSPVELQKELAEPLAPFGKKTIGVSDVVNLLSDKGLIGTAPFEKWLTTKLNSKLYPDRPAETSLTFRDFANSGALKADLYVFSANSNDGVVCDYAIKGGRCASPQKEVVRSIVDSMSIPFVFPPVLDGNGKPVFDGGLLANFPLVKLTDAFRGLHNAAPDPIGLVLDEVDESVGLQKTLAAVLRTITDAQNSQEQNDLQSAGKLIRIACNPVTTLDLILPENATETLITAGRHAALAFIQQRQIHLPAGFRVDGSNIDALHLGNAVHAQSAKLAVSRESAKRELQRARPNKWRLMYWALWRLKPIWMGIGHALIASGIVWPLLLLRPASPDRCLGLWVNDETPPGYRYVTNSSGRLEQLNLADGSVEEISSCDWPNWTRESQ